MYIRETISKRKHGPPVKYIDLAENKWNPKKKKSETNILCKFGRVDQLNERQIRNIAYKLISYLEEKCEYSSYLEVEKITEFGLVFLLHNVWKKIKFDKFFKTELENYNYELIVEKAILGMVASYLHGPSTHSTAYNWLKEDTFFQSDELSLHHFYRALDFLENNRIDIEQKLSFICNLNKQRNKTVFFLYYSH